MMREYRNVLHACNPLLEKRLRDTVSQGGEMGIPDRLKARRQELGINQLVAAGMIGVSARTLCSWENGDIRAISVARLHAIASFVRADPSVLLSEWTGIAPSPTVPA
jgi:DNA-binding XRE family transcriptional regulator